MKRSAGENGIHIRSTVRSPLKEPVRSPMKQIVVGVNLLRLITQKSSPLK